MDLQMVTPAGIDWDQDGDVDLVCGDEDGRVALVENTGSLVDGAPVFGEPRYFQQEAAQLKFGALATPFAVDIDEDGDEDILCGNTAGYIGWFENLGGDDGSPKFASVELLGATPVGRAPVGAVPRSQSPFRIMAGPNGSIQGPCEAKWGYTTVSVHGNSILANTILGDVIQITVGAPRLASFASVEHGGANSAMLPNLFRGGHHIDVQHIGFVAPTDTPEPRWSWGDASDHKLKTQWRTTPLVVGENLVMLDREGHLAEFKIDSESEHQSLVMGRLAKPMAVGQAQRVFIDEDNRPIRLNRKSCGSSGRYKLAATDWDGDGRVDFLVNSENATWYRNCEDRDGKIVLKKIGNLAKRNVAGHTSSPAVCDFDNDGKPDLLVGAENGRIYHIKHDDCVKYSDEQLLARPPKPTPAPRFTGLVKEEFVFTKAKFPQCHASTICETSRGLVVAWFGGTKEKDKDVGIWVSYHDGNGWSAPKEWANGVQHSEHRHPCWNPVLYQPPGDAPTLLFFKVGPNPAEWWGEMMVSYDRGRTFRERRRLPETIDGPVRCKPILLPDGETLLSGSSTEYDGWTVHFEKTRLADGQPSGTWKRIGPINTKDEFNAIQPTFLQHKDGRLQVLCRTKESVIATSFSDDGGETWSKMEATNLPNPNSGIEVVTLKDGRHLLIYNHLGSGKTGWGRRGLLNLAISDDGLVWKKVAVLEQDEKAEFSYPAIIQADDGLVHMSYTWKRQRIKHVVVDPALLNTGDVLSLDNWQGEN